MKSDRHPKVRRRDIGLQGYLSNCSMLLCIVAIAATPVGGHPGIKRGMHKEDNFGPIAPVTTDGIVRVMPTTLTLTATSWGTFAFSMPPTGTGRAVSYTPTTSLDLEYDTMSMLFDDTSTWSPLMTTSNAATSVYGPNHTSTGMAQEASILNSTTHTQQPTISAHVINATVTTTTEVSLPPDVAATTGVTSFPPLPSSVWITATRTQTTYMNTTIVVEAPSSAMIKSSSSSVSILGALPKITAPSVLSSLSQEFSVLPITAVNKTTSTTQCTKIVTVTVTVTVSVGVNVTVPSVMMHTRTVTASELAPPDTTTVAGPKSTSPMIMASSMAETGATQSPGMSMTMSSTARLNATTPMPSPRSSPSASFRTSWPYDFWATVASYRSKTVAGDSSVDSTTRTVARLHERSFIASTAATTTAPTEGNEWNQKVTKILSFKRIPSKSTTILATAPTSARDR
ncbi:hypothetical protein RBB50_001705 [Rhinocladiella similis]